jgi:hypothetical protein
VFSCGENQPSTPEPLENVSIGYKLATIDAGYAGAKDDIKINRVRYLLDTLADH